MKIFIEDQQQHDAFHLDQSEQMAIPTHLFHTNSIQSEIDFFEQSSPISSNCSLPRIQQQSSSKAQSTQHLSPVKENQIPPALPTFFCQKKQQRTNDQNQKTKSIKKKNRKYSKKAPDYKKNICGYITKKIVKEATGSQFRPVVNDLCHQLSVDVNYFQKTFKTFENITGPTHLYSLVKPRLEGLSIADQIKQIQTKRIFRVFFIWFLRNRYLRYLLNEGKMDKKDIYIRYKNKQLLHLITQQGELFENTIEAHVEQLDRIVQKKTEIICGQEAKKTLKSISQKIYKRNFPIFSDITKIQKNEKKLKVEKNQKQIVIQKQNIIPQLSVKRQISQELRIKYQMQNQDRQKEIHDSNTNALSFEEMVVCSYIK